MGLAPAETRAGSRRHVTHLLRRVQRSPAIDPGAAIGYSRKMCCGRPCLFAILLFSLAGAACDSRPSEIGAPASPPAPTAGATTAAARRFEAPSLTYPAPERLVAIGDVHGDLDATRRALRLAGAIDASDAWTGGSLFVVQTGDQIDRGDEDRAVLDLFERLRDEAKAKGGTVLSLNGNHELMNVELDFRYITERSFASFAELSKDDHPAVARVPEAQRGRAAAFLPGGVYAKRLAERPVVAIVGDGVFVHAGVLMKHLTYGLEKLDGETRGWLRGERATPPRAVVAEDGVVWTRAFSAQTGQRDCDDLGKVLDALGGKRMVMGHTPQKPGISEACDGRAVRIDTGMSRHYGGQVQVLEIAGGKTRVLKE